MTSEQLKATLRQQPFRPFTIRMVDGQSFTVSHPDWVMVSPTGGSAAAGCGDPDRRKPWLFARSVKWPKGRDDFGHG